MGQSIQYLQVRLEAEDGDRDGAGTGGGIDRSACDGDHFHLMRNGEQQCGDSCGAEGQSRKKHIVTSAVEHSSVLNYCMALEKEGYRVTYLPVDREGLLKLADLENAITEETAVVSLMWANNETGVLFPVKEIADICRSRGVLFHCDAVQAAGKIEIDVRNVQADYLSLTGHKFHAPKGIGALYSFIFPPTFLSRAEWLAFPHFP